MSRIAYIVIITNAMKSEPSTNSTLLGPDGFIGTSAPGLL